MFTRPTTHKIHSIMDDHMTLTPKTSRALAHLALLSCVMFLWPQASSAQNTPAQSKDRLKLLYSSQLSFTPEGDPIIRLGVLQNERKIEFTPNETIRVLPNGEGGPEIELPGGRTYSVAIKKSQAGQYKHWIIVGRLPVSQRESQEQIEQEWLQRGHVVRAFEVGGLFAVKGKVFDSRVMLFAVGGTSNIKEARKIQRKMQAKFGIEGGLHSELVSYPQGTLTLSSQGLPIAVTHQNILHVAAKRGRTEKIQYTVPNIRKNYVKGRETRTYTGNLIFAPDRRGNLVLINSLGAERVLKGVVPSEIFASAPQAALQAQAIAARNEIFSAIGVRNLADPYMLRADIYDQVYGGSGRERASTSKAVDATRGKVMFYKKQIVEAFYSSNAGGHTENNENVWDMEPRPYLRGKADAPKGTVPAAFKDGISTKELPAFLKSTFPAHSKTAPASSARLYRWTKTVPVSKPVAWLKAAGHNIGAIRDIKILKRGVSGRIVRMELVGSRGKAVVERELNVRRLFGGLRSGLFTMTIKKKAGTVRSISFDGAGFGHGVGMCQTGAIGMAAKGHSFESILKHYYQGISIKGLY